MQEISCFRQLQYPSVWEQILYTNKINKESELRSINFCSIEVQMKSTKQIQSDDSKTTNTQKYLIAKNHSTQRCVLERKNIPNVRQHKQYSLALDFSVVFFLCSICLFLFHFDNARNSPENFRIQNMAIICFD